MQLLETPSACANSTPVVRSHESTWQTRPSASKGAPGFTRRFMAERSGLPRWRPSARINAPCFAFGPTAHVSRVAAVVRTAPAEPDVAFLRLTASKDQRPRTAL